MRLGRRHIGLVKLDWRAGEGSVGVAALTFQPVLRAIRSGNHVGLVIRFEVGDLIITNVRGVFSGCLYCDSPVGILTLADRRQSATEFAVEHSPPV